MSLAGVRVTGLGAAEVEEGMKLNLRRSLKASSLGDIIESGLVIERGEVIDSELDGDHMMTWQWR